MARYSNMSTALINTPSGVMMPPGQAVEISDDDAGNARFKELIDLKMVIAGDPPTTDDAKAKLTADQAQVLADQAAKLPPPPPMASTVAAGSSGGATTTSGGATTTTGGTKTS